MNLNSSTGLEIESVDRTGMRTVVAKSTKYVKNTFTNIPDQIVEFNDKVAKEIGLKWDKELTKIARKRKISDKQYQELLQSIKTLRIQGISKLSEKWYNILRKIRSEMALICAMYEFSEIEAISSKKHTFIIKQISNLKPLVLRLKLPKIPSNEVYKFKVEFVKSFQPLIPMADKISNKRLFTRDMEKICANQETAYLKKFKVNKTEKLDSAESLKVNRELIRKMYLQTSIIIAKKWFPKLKKAGLKHPEIKQMKKYFELKVDIEEISAQKISRQIKSDIFKLKMPQAPKTDISEFKSYNLGKAFKQMVKILEDTAFETAEFITKLTIPRTKLKIQIKIKRYKESLVAREYLTLICQAVAPRQNAVYAESNNQPNTFDE